MKKSLPLTILLIAFQTLVCSAQDTATKTKTKTNKNSVNPAGTWRLEYELDGNKFKDAYRLKRGEGNALRGTLYRNDSKHRIQDGKIDGDTISFTVKVEYEGTEWTVNYTGKIDGDAIEGDAVISGNDQSFDVPWKPKRSVEMGDVVGTWQLQINAPDGNTFAPTLRITKQGDTFVSQYLAPEAGGELEIEKLRVEDNELRFTLNTEYEGSPLKLDYRGRPYDDKIEGTIDYDVSGNTGEMPFTAKREAAKKSDD